MADQETFQKENQQSLIKWRAKARRQCCGINSKFDNYENNYAIYKSGNVNRELLERENICLTKKGLSITIEFLKLLHLRYQEGTQETFRYWGQRYFLIIIPTETKKDLFKKAYRQRLREQSSFRGKEGR